MRGAHNRPCLRCGQLTRNRPTYCNHCTPDSPPTQRATHQWQQTSKQTIAHWITTHGHWCPGWQVPPHPSTDLTTDHPTALARGSTHQQPLTVLCRRCNARKGASR